MGKVNDPKRSCLNPLRCLIFLHIPSILHTQLILFYLPVFLQGVPSIFLLMQFLFIITDQIQNYSFPTNAPGSSILKDTFYFFFDTSFSWPERVL